MWKKRWTMSPEYESYGTCWPVIWNDVLGSVLKFVTRVSGSAHGDGGSVGSAVQLERPVAPVVRRCRSPRSRAPDSVCSCASVTGSGGAKPASGLGKGE